MTRIQSLVPLEAPADEDAFLIARETDGVWFKVPWRVVAASGGGGGGTSLELDGGDAAGSDGSIIIDGGGA